jgi:hypothetical protein
MNLNSRDLEALEFDRWDPNYTYFYLDLNPKSLRSTREIF